MGGVSNRLIAVGATGARQLLGATALGRDGWGAMVMGHDGDCLIAVGATAEARRLLGATVMGHPGGGTTAWWVEGSWAQRRCATTAGA